MSGKIPRGAPRRRGRSSHQALVKAARQAGALAAKVINPSTVQTADRARPAMEACGIDVFATVRKHGFTIDVVRTRGDPEHYFGLVLVE